MDFSDSELITALGEIQYGLISSSIETKLEKGQARAKLNLLEPGITVNIVVSEAGWSAVSKTQDGVATEVDSRAFETLDQLLTFLSPAFDDRRIKLLFEKLATISKRKSWSEEYDVDVENCIH